MAGARATPAGALPARSIPLTPLQAGESAQATGLRTGPASHFAGVGQPLSRKAMVTDIFLVGAWGAMIPGLMWLGAVLGF